MATPFEIQRGLRNQLDFIEKAIATRKNLSKGHRAWLERSHKSLYASLTASQLENFDRG